MAALREPDGLTSPPPTTPDRLLRLDNVITGMNPPAELRSLRSTHSFTVLESAADFVPESVLRRIDTGSGRAAWNLPGDRVVRGLVGQGAGRLSHEEVQQAGDAGRATTGHRPGWADLIYHPKLSPGLLRPALRR